MAYSVAGSGRMDGRTGAVLAWRHATMLTRRYGTGDGRSAKRTCRGGRRIARALGCGDAAAEEGEEQEILSYLTSYVPRYQTTLAALLYLRRAEETRLGPSARSLVCGGLCVEKRSDGRPACSFHLPCP